jgi:crossover junction endodeoxyribonuclease RuvC
MPRVLGIDPGSLLTGFGCVESADPAGFRPKLVDAGLIRLKREWRLPDRLLQLHEDLTGIIRDLKPEVIAVEALFTHYQKPAPVIVMGHARGVILLAAKQAGAPLVELRPAAVKKATTGFGNARKAQMQQAVALEFGIAPPKPADIADALAVALCAIRRGSVLEATAGLIGRGHS